MEKKGRPTREFVMCRLTAQCHDKCVICSSLCLSSSLVTEF